MFDRHPPLIATVLLGLILPQSACSLIGYGIGAAIDAGGNRTLAPQDLEHETLEPGQEMELKLIGGRTVHGEYVGLEQLWPEEYSARYADTRELHRLVVPLPGLGDAVTLHMTHGAELDAVFLGFDLFGVSVRTPGRWEPEHVRPQDIDELRVGGYATITGEELALLLSEGALPFRSAVVVQLPPPFDGTAGQLLVPLHLINRIKLKSTSGRTTGLAIGSAIDLAIIEGLASAAVNARCGRVSCTG